MMCRNHIHLFNSNWEEFVLDLKIRRQYLQRMMIYNLCYDHLSYSVNNYMLGYGLISYNLHIIIFEIVRLSLEHFNPLSKQTVLIARLNESDFRRRSYPPCFFTLCHQSKQLFSPISSSRLSI